MYTISAKEAMICCTAAYQTQHFAYCLTSLFFPQYSNAGMFHWNVVCWLLFAASYGLFFFSFALRLPEKGHCQADVSNAVGTTVSSLSLSLILSAIAQTDSDSSRVLYSVCLLYAMSCCFYILWNQSGRKIQLDTQRELSLQEQAFQKYREQYQMSMDTAELINRKCHDLKHQIAALKQVSDNDKRNAGIEQLEKEIMIYDSFVKTGNTILDTLLTEKGLASPIMNQQYNDFHRVCFSLRRGNLFSSVSFALLCW